MVDVSDFGPGCRESVFVGDSLHLAFLFDAQVRFLYQGSFLVDVSLKDGMRNLGKLAAQKRFVALAFGGQRKVTVVSGRKVAGALRRSGRFGQR